MTQMPDSFRQFSQKLSSLQHLDIVGVWILGRAGKRCFQLRLGKQSNETARDSYLYFYVNCVIVLCHPDSQSQNGLVLLQLIQNTFLKIYNIRKWSEKGYTFFGLVIFLISETEEKMKIISLSQAHVFHALHADLFKRLNPKAFVSGSGKYMCLYRDPHKMWENTQPRCSLMMHDVEKGHYFLSLHLEQYQNVKESQ